MTNGRLSEMDTTDLLEHYVELSVRQSAAADLVETSLVNRLGDQIYKIGNELKRRPDDRGRALMTLFEHPSMDVRFNAATSLMSVFPIEARRQIEKIAVSKSYPVAGRAGMYLSMIDGKYSE